MKSTRGLTFMICVGSYGGFSVWVNKIRGVRICIAYVSIAVHFYDIENTVSNILDKLDGNKPHEQ